MTQSTYLDRNSPPHISTLVLIAGLSALSMNIFLPSLPGMARYFETSYQFMQLSVPLYLLLSALLQVVIGPISDRFGRRPVMLGSLCLFILATIGTILAPTAEIFLALRMTQAVIASGLVLSRAVVRDIVSNAQAASMIAYVTMGMSIAPMFGPAIGGVLDDVYGWRASFSMLLALGVLTLAIVWADMGETLKARSTSLSEQLRQYPTLLRSSTFWAYTLCASFTSGTFFAYMGGAPFVGTEVFKLSASEVGTYFATAAVGYMLGNFLAGRFSMRTGMNRMLIAGCTVTVVAMAILAVLTIAGIHSPYVFFALTSVLGLGNGMCMPNANAGILSVAPSLTGTAAGLGGAITIGGGAAFAVIAGALLTPTSGELPLVLLMLASAILAPLPVLWIMRHEKAA